MQQQLEQSQKAMANTRSEASSEGQYPVDRPDSEALELGHTNLASTIMATIHKAQAEAARAVRDSMRPLLGDGDAMSFLGEQVEAGIARLRTDDEETAEPAARRGVVNARSPA